MTPAYRTQWPQVQTPLCQPMTMVERRSGEPAHGDFHHLDVVGTHRNHRLVRGCQPSRTQDAARAATSRRTMIADLPKLRQVLRRSPWSFAAASAARPQPWNGQNEL